MKENAELIVSPSFFPLLEDKHRYLVLCGGAGSGKTEFAARKIFYRCQKEGGHRFLILRKVRSRVQESVLEVFRCLLRETEVAYDLNKTSRVISWIGPDGRLNEVLFDGLDDPEKIKSIKGITGEWLEETTNFTKNDFLQLDLRLREPGPAYHQIILSFNPDEAQAPWLKEMFFDHLNPNAYVHNSTIADNPIAEVRAKYAVQLNDLKAQDETMYSIYGLGIWAVAKGKIYAWDIVSAPGVRSDEECISTFDDIFYGGDFGYSVNPAALIKIYRKADEFWLQEMIYETGLTNQDIGNKMIADPEIDTKLPNYWDSAEGKSIEEIHRMGINAIPAPKGPDSVRTGIDYLKAQKIHIVAGSENIIREAGRYKRREDKNGNPLPEPVKFDDHAMDAIRYGIYTHCAGRIERHFHFI